MRAPEPAVARRIVIAILLLVLAAVGFAFREEVGRRLGFARTGTVQVGEHVFYLQPTDTYLTQYVLDHGTYEPTETALFLSKLRPGDTVIDVGANIGWYTVQACKAVGPTGRVVAFEPEPVSFGYLERNVAMSGCDNVALEQKALSNEVGYLELFVAEEHLGQHHLGDRGVGEKSIQVAALPFDEYHRELGGRVDVVKIDTEGAEGYIVEGMTELLASGEALRMFVEYSPGNLDGAGYDPQELLERLESAGFAVHLVSEARDAVLDVADLSDLPRLQGEDPTALNLYLER